LKSAPTYPGWISGSIPANNHDTIETDDNDSPRQVNIAVQPVPGLDSGERRTTMAKEYSVTLHEPPTTQIIREGMEQHLNQVAQDGWRMVSVVKESGYFYFFWERD
jgi:hypothetical protein